MINIGCQRHSRDLNRRVCILQARLKEIDKLDQWLQDAVREGDRPVMQAVCATQWNLCLPLLQHNLRKRIRTPLCRVAQVLEDIQRFACSSGSLWFLLLGIKTWSLLVCLNEWFCTLLSTGK